MSKEKVKRILRPIFKGSNMLAFLCLVFASIGLYLIGARLMANIILVIAALFIILNRLDNLDKRLRILEGD